MQLGLISEHYHKKRVSLHTWFPCKAKSEKSQLFQSKWSNAFQIQIGIDPLRSGGVGGDRGGWADNKGQRRCVLHSFKPSLKETNIRWFAVLRRGENGGLDATRNTSKRRQTAPASSLQPKDSHYLRGKRQCVLEEEMLILVLILKGPDRSIALSSLWKREINMFLKTKQAACGVCVWASLIPPDVYREEPLLKKKKYHVWGSRAFTFFY